MAELVELSSNNLFRYATSELSQDAFICWLVSFALRENESVDKALTLCAREFIGRFYSLGDTEYVTVISKQHRHIDVLVEIGKTKIILEDKTFTDSHDDQIARYKKELMDEGIPSEDIKCIYYKIVEQSKPEDNVDYEFTRTDLLSIFRKYYPLTTNRIFLDYVDYLNWIDAQTLNYQSIPIVQWNEYQYRGFFSDLMKSGMLGRYGSPGGDWGYVANASGGFWGLWFYGTERKDMNRMGLTEDILADMYLQIEDNLLAVKVAAADNGDKKVIQTARRAIFDYLQKMLGDEFQKKTFRSGTWMTVGYIQFDERNYGQQIKLMTDAMDKMLQEFRF